MKLTRKRRAPATPRPVVDDTPLVATGGPFFGSVESVVVNGVRLVRGSHGQLVGVTQRVEHGQPPVRPKRS